MSVSVPQLQLFALLTAIEHDIRDIVRDNLSITVDLRSLIDNETLQKCIDRLNKDRGISEDTIQTFDIIQYMDLGDSLKSVNKHLNVLPSSFQQHLRHVQQQLQGIVPTRNRVMHGRPLEFDDYTRVTDLCRALVKAQTFLWRETRRVQSEIRQNPNYVTALSIPETDDVASKLHNLPAPDFGDTGFLGREDEFAELKRAVTGSYPVITLLGEGGVGKSALALKLCYEIVDDPNAQFDGVI
jgi:LuxR family transcriptional regulator, glucitol operon activator